MPRKPFSAKRDPLLKGIGIERARINEQIGGNCQDEEMDRDGLFNGFLRSFGNSEKPDSVLEIDSGQGNLEADLNHKNLISAEPEVFLNESVQKNRTLTLDGVRLDLNYQDSLYYPVGGETVNRYLVDGKEDQPILLDEKGNIHSILYHFAKLSILPTDSYEDVLEPLKEELSKTFDLSYYKEQIPLGSAMGSRGFGMYDYLFCNRSNGYITDSLRVSVSEDGSVLGLRIRNFTGTCDLSRIDKTGKTNGLSRN